MTWANANGCPCDKHDCLEALVTIAPTFEGKEEILDWMFTNVVTGTMSESDHAVWQE